MASAKKNIVVYALIPRPLHRELELLREKQGGRTLASLVREALEDIIKKYASSGAKK